MSENFGHFPVDAKNFLLVCNRSVVLRFSGDQAVPTSRNETELKRQSGRLCDRARGGRQPPPRSPATRHARLKFGRSCDGGDTGIVESKLQVEMVSFITSFYEFLGSRQAAPQRARQKIAARHNRDTRCPLPLRCQPGCVTSYRARCRWQAMFGRASRRGHG